jgi:hypothetical protein
VPQCFPIAENSRQLFKNADFFVDFSSKNQKDLPQICVPPCFDPAFLKPPIAVLQFSPVVLG